MKLRVEVEVEISKAMAETMERNGFLVCCGGTAMQIKVGSAPAIPRRKTKITFKRIEETEKACEEVCK
jgi:hypothetical protein